MIQVYNTLTRQKEEFVPREEGVVGIYVCGVTPYDDSHIGHAVPSVIWDAIQRFLEYSGYKVKLIQNFTDVDDKVINRSFKENRPALEISAYYSEKYLEAMQALKVKPAYAYPKVSEHIDEIVDVIERIIERGYGYVADGDVYFDVEKFSSYGKLSGQKLEDLEAGTRFEVDEAKRHPADFALWKKAKPGEPAWDSPWGKGRPGWHIECSAMALKYLGSGFDFHGGGVDLIFPHHENEIAQSEAATGKPYVRYWVHNGLLKTKDEKMSKSLGNFVTIDDLLSRYPAEMLRFYILSSHYRSPLEFSEAKLEEARRGWERLNNGVSDLRQYLAQTDFQQDDGIAPNPDFLSAVLNARQRFLAAMSDDFNTGQAVGVLFDLLRQVNIYRGRVGEMGEQDAKSANHALQQALEVFDELAGGILGILGEKGLPDEGLIGSLMDIILDLRQKARKERNWQTADEIRDRLGGLGIVIEDTPSGTRWKFS